MRTALAGNEFRMLPAAGSFFCQFSRTRRSRQQRSALRSAGLIPRTLAEYGMAEQLRITVGMPEHNARVVEILAALMLSAPRRGARLGNETCAIFTSSAVEIAVFLPVSGSGGRRRGGSAPCTGNTGLAVRQMMGQSLRMSWK